MVPGRADSGRTRETGVANSGGLAFGASGQVLVTIAPSFRLPIGVRLDAGVPPAERFYIVEDRTPEVTLAVPVSGMAGAVNA